MPPSSLLGSAVYVRYKDHVLFKNLENPPAEAMERETIGWLAEETEEVVLIHHDRAVPDCEKPSGRCNGVIVLKPVLIEMRKLPLRDAEAIILNYTKRMDDSEYALQPKKRKTQPKPANREGRM